MPPRSRPVGADPRRHPFGLTREQSALRRLNTHVSRRVDAVEAARALGIVLVPPHWTRSERLLAQTNVFVDTRWVRLARPELPELPLADALGKRRSFTRPAPEPAQASGTFVELGQRWLEHERAMATQRPGSLRAHGSDAIESIGIDTPLAVVTATTGSTRAQVRSSHVVRVAEVLDAPHPTVDAAARWASDELLRGELLTPLALVRLASGGVRVVSLASSSLGLGADGEPLVGSLAASGTSLDWRATSPAVAAIVGLDGVHWM